jgi:hypothetical protein
MTQQSPELGSTGQMATMRRTATRRPVLGSREDRSIAGFCYRHGWSRSTYENNRRLGLGPRETRARPGAKVTITEPSEAEYDAKHTTP